MIEWWQILYGAGATVGNTQARRLLTQLNPSQGPYYGQLEYLDDGGTASYNALIASVDSSNFRNWGVRFTARYTYSVSKDNLSSTFSESGNNFNLGYTDPFNPNSCEKKSWACAAGASTEAHTSAAAPHGSNFPDRINLLLSRNMTHPSVELPYRQVHRLTARGRGRDRARMRGHRTSRDAGPAIPASRHDRRMLR